LAAAIKQLVPEAEIELIAAGAGIFNVKVGEVEYWNKHQKGGFPNQDEFVKYLAFKIKQQKST
jgi:predicted Rdx family selenoprotein